MTTIHFNFSDNDLLKKVAKAAFPEYTGRKLRVRYGVKQMSVRSYWNEGSRDYFAAVNLATLKAEAAPTSHPFFNRAVTGVDNVTIPEGFVIVEHSIHRGVDVGITVHTPVEAPMLPSGEDFELDSVDIRVLKATAGYKSSYAGISDYRMYELTNCYNKADRLTKAQVEASREKMITLGYMTKNKAISTKGKNALELYR